MLFKKELSIIKVRLNGGLGNQLFKFFHGLKVALKYGENFVIDISWFEHNYMISNKVHNRKYELSFFKPIDKIPIYISKNQNYDSFRGRIERRLAPKIQKALGCMTEQSEYLFENPPRVIDGHFDKLDHLPDFKTISKYIEFPKSESDWLKGEFSNLNEHMSVAIHVRRTDYINLPELYSVLTINYYRNSINYFREKYSPVSFWLFSDDLIGAQKFLQNLITFDRIVYSPNSVHVGEHLQLMSSFQGIVTANSTFSWWAAYIGFNSGKTLDVIIPSKISTLDSDNPFKYLKLPGWNMFDV